MNIEKAGTISELRQTDADYEGEEILLLGYYESGDKNPLLYKYTTQNFSTLVDDGGAVIKTTLGSWIAQFNNDSVDVRDFGIRTGEDCLSKLNKIKAYLVTKSGGIIYFPNGNYLLSGTFTFEDNIFIEGESLNVTLNATVPLSAMISTKDSYTSTLKTLTKLGDFKNGNYTYDITDTEVLLNVGDVVRFKSNQRFTREWDNGIAQRDYWLDGELLEIDEGTTSSSLFFKQRNVLTFNATDITDFDAWTPNKNNGINNITLVNVKNTTTQSECLRIRFASNFKVGKIKTYNSNYAGINVQSSFNTTIEDFEGEGGTPDLQLNYGILVQNGSKYTTVKRLKGRYYRHSFSAGGTGFAIPMFCEVLSAVSNNSTSLGMDTHANSAYFTFHNITTDYGMIICGLGHSVLNAVSSFGGLNICQTGKNCYFGNIKLLAHSHMQMVNTQNGDPQAYVNCYFDNIYIEMFPNGVSSKDYFWETQAWGTGNTYNNITIINKVFDTTKTEAQNIASLYGRTGVPITFRNNDTVGSLKLVGFPKGITIKGSNVNVKNLVLEDCVWGEGAILNTMVSITEGSNIVINKIVASINHTLNIDLANHIRITNTTAGAISNVLVENFTYTGRAFPVGFFINNGATGDIIFENWNITKPISNSINPTALLGFKVKNIKIYPDTVYDEISTVAALKVTDSSEGKIISLLGYYTAGDKPVVRYRYATANFDTLVDDGGSIIKTTKGSWIAQFNNDSVDVRDFGIKVGDTNSTALWTKLNTYCVANNKYIDLSIDVILVFSTNTNIYTANIRGRGVNLTLDGLVWFRTDNLTTVDISGFNVIVKNNYTTLVSTNGSTNIFYNPSAVYNANRKVSYRDLTCTAEAPLYDGSNRLSGFIRDGGYNQGVYRNIITTNVSNSIITNTGASSRNHIIENITAYNFGTCIWAQGENQKVRNIKAYNTPTQATNWVNKNNTTTPRDVNGFDVVLASGNGLELTEIYGENPIERVVYIQCNDVKADNIYSLNGDGVKFVGQGYSSICRNIYISNVRLEYDSTFALTFNVTCFQIYWVDNWEINNVTVNNKNTTADILLNLYSFKRNAKNVRINNVTMVGDRGVVAPVGGFAAHDADTAGTIPYQNIEINNVKAIKSKGRNSATFNHYTAAPTETLISNLKITNCYINYQKISENGDDAIYRIDRIDGFEARGNSSNVRGQWVGGFPNPAPLGTYTNVFIQEDNFKATNIETCISAMNQGLNLLPGSYINFEILKGNNLKFVFKGNGLSYMDWRVSNTSNNTITATDRTFFIETITKADAYTSCNIKTNVKTAVTGVVPTTLVNYTDGGTTVSVRGDTYSGNYEFRAQIFI